MIPTLIITDPSWEKHDPGSEHPESRWRAQAAFRALETLPENCVQQETARAASVEELCQVHDEKYVQHVLSLDGQKASLDGETHLSPDSVHAALTSAGAAIDLTRAVITGDAQNGFAPTRPPGHHATVDRGMGFCVFNNAALAAAECLTQGRTPLIVDIDVHHGNGTEDILQKRLTDAHFISLHEDNLFPKDSGASSAGRIINLPLPHPTGSKTYSSALLSALEQKNHAGIDVVILSLGFDTLRNDPLAGLDISLPEFLKAIQDILDWTKAHCEGRLVVLLEGGYDTQALEEGIRGLVKLLSTRST